MAFLIFTLLFSHLLHASIASSELKKETELKIALTKAGYENLRSQFLKDFKGEKIKRTDYYFEIFDNENYLLKKVEPVIKLRFMWDGLDLKWQVQETQKSWVYSIFSFKETLAESFKLNSGERLLKDIEHYHDLLMKLDPKALEVAQKIQSIMTEKGVISFSNRLCSLCSQGQNFYSSHMNEKTRAKIKLRLGKEQFSLQVGETDNAGILSYELEIEPKGDGNLQESSMLLKAWLTQRGLTAAHIETSPGIDPTVPSENALKHLIY